MIHCIHTSAIVALLSATVCIAMALVIRNSQSPSHANSRCTSARITTDLNAFPHTLVRGANGALDSYDLNNMNARVDALSTRASTLEATVTRLGIELNDTKSRFGSGFFNNGAHTVRDELDRKQVVGNYLVKGGHYNFAVRSNGGDGAYYNIDYWAKNGHNPAWIKNGGVSDAACRGANHRCVKIG